MKPPFEVAQVLNRNRGRLSQIVPNTRKLRALYTIADCRTQVPRGFTRIQHYGILISAVKKEVIPVLQQQTGIPELHQKTKIKHRICPICQKGELIILAIVKARGPPLSTFIQRLSIPA